MGWKVDLDKVVFVRASRTKVSCLEDKTIIVDPFICRAIGTVRLNLDSSISNKVTGLRGSHT
jgi:hypothetical protein